MNSRNVAGIIALGLFVGGLTFFSPAAHPGSATSPIQGYPINKNPANAPVVVRGGSLELRSANPWSIDNTAHTASTIGADLSGIAVDGVTTADVSNLDKGIEESAGEKTGSNANPLTMNWKVTLIFRNTGGIDGGGADDQKPKLQICSDSGWGATGPINGHTLYLVGDASGTFTVEADKIDGQSILRYDLNACGTGSGRDSKCNHVRKIKVKIDTVNQWDSGHPLDENNNPLWCLAGQCDVGIGQP